MRTAQPERCQCHVLPDHRPLSSVSREGTWHCCIIENPSRRCASLHHSSGAWRLDEPLCHALRARSGVGERTRRIPLLSFKTLLSADSTRGGGAPAGRHVQGCHRLLWYKGMCLGRNAAFGPESVWSLHLLAPEVTRGFTCLDSFLSYETKKAIKERAARAVWSMSLKVRTRVPFSAALATLTRRPSSRTD